MTKLVDVLLFQSQLLKQKCYTYINSYTVLPSNQLYTVCSIVPYCILYIFDSYANNDIGIALMCQCHW